MHLLAISLVESSASFLQKGGIFIWPLIICSIIGIMAIVFKALSLSASRIVPARLADQMESANRDDITKLEAQLRSGRSTLARLGDLTVSSQANPQLNLHKSLEAGAREEIVQMHAGIGVLDVVITIAPLLGLLGTASGLVTIFDGLGETTDHLAIARGIAEALGTTIFGLAIAVPCVIAHSYFTRRIERLTARLESVLTRFSSIVSAP